MPRGYAALPNTVLADLLCLLAPLDVEGDAYGLIFECFMGEFASAFMQKGREYFTPASIVKEAKHAPMSGQKARVEALRQDRTERVKQALSTASSHSTLFKSAG